MVKVGDGVRFKIAYNNSKRKITKETDMVLKGIVIEVSDAGILVSSPSSVLPYFVTYDRILKVGGAG